jgi:hypothetical protein
MATGFLPITINPLTNNHLTNEPFNKLNTQPITTLIMQNKPNLPDAQINVTSTITKYYENARLRGREKNKPNQTQFQSHSFWACFNFLLWDVVPGKLYSVTV